MLDTEMDHRHVFRKLQAVPWRRPVSIPRDHKYIWDPSSRDCLALDPSFAIFGPLFVIIEPHLQGTRFKPWFLDERGARVWSDLVVIWISFTERVDGTVCGQ